MFSGLLAHHGGGDEVEVGEELLTVIEGGRW